MLTDKTYPMTEDTVVGDGGNVTVYARPDGSRYGLDKKGNGEEREAGEPVFGRARFDSRALASGRWEGSRSTEQAKDPSQIAPRRARPSRH
jgi:hypothetical protein